uniref:L-aminoadipate-semialdehyde dehydrogenase-phosphopantetheinyl transferase n=1 Tax=Ciona savignyi TaxID=51511 RepID=H2ZG08_CIOSA
MRGTCKYAFESAKWMPSLSDWSLAGQCIQQNERVRISEFCYKDDAKLSLCTRLLIRYVLCKCLGEDWSTLKLTRTERGKPLLNHSVHKRKVFFNASHQGDFAVVAANCEHNIGVDIMDIREQHGNVDTFFNLMDRQFTSDEWKCIKQPSNPSEQMRLFYRHWCLKESYVKALGDGITYDLQSLNFKVLSPLTNVETNDTQLAVSGSTETDWRFIETMLDENHCVCVAINKQTVEGSTSSFKLLTFEDIMALAKPLCKASDIEEQFLSSFNNPFKVKRYV